MLNNVGRVLQHPVYAQAQLVGNVLLFLTIQEMCVLLVVIVIGLG